MQRLANFDVSRQFTSRWAQNTAQIVFGVVCAATMMGLRTVFDLWAPTSGPFAMIYPTVLLATLYGHWRAGVTSLVLTFAWAWYFVLPVPYSLSFVDPADPAGVLLNGICCLIVIVFAEAFRRAARVTMDHVSRAASRRLTLLAELEHRTKNNFALVASMLELQKRTLTDSTLHAPIDDAVSRVRTFADAYSSLAAEQAEESDVEIKPYLGTLLDRLQAAAIPAEVRLYREIDNKAMPREQAVAIGLYVNEALSNCVKYAFPDGRPGSIGVFFDVTGDSWRVAIEDDGIGLADQDADRSGLGTKLMGAFARQAGAEHRIERLEKGIRVELISETARAGVA